MARRRPVVLVIEDNEDIRDLLAVFLLDKGYHILEAADGRQGVNLAREAHPDVVLMDLNMPNLNGLQATIILKNHAETESISIVALSSLCAERDWREKAIQVGCDHCITKPIDFAELAEVVDALLRECAT